MLQWIYNIRTIKSQKLSCVATTVSISLLHQSLDLLNHRYSPNSELGTEVLQHNSLNSELTDDDLQIVESGWE